MTTATTPEAHVKRPISEAAIDRLIAQADAGRFDPYPYSAKQRIQAMALSIGLRVHGHKDGETKTRVSNYSVFDGNERCILAHKRASEVYSFLVNRGATE